MNNITALLSAALIAVLVLTFFVNIVVAITKKVVAWDKFPTQVWVLVVSLVCTYVAAAVFAAVQHVNTVWYYWVATGVVALFVCYAAMFGYDNLYKQIKELIDKIGSK